MDYFCPAKGLIVELDGDTHDPAKDVARDADLRKRYAFVTLRFNNRDVMANMTGVLARLLLILDELPDRWAGSTTPGPSSEEEGRGL